MFKFKGISSKDMQVVVQEEEHFIARASQRYEVTEIEGRDGALFDALGYSYVERPIYVQCLNISKIDDILAWLNGEGEFEYKGRKTTARFYSQLEPSRNACIRIIDTTFIRDPFWTKADDEYETINESRIITTEIAKEITAEECEDSIAKLDITDGNTYQKTQEAVTGKTAEGEYITVNDVELEDGIIEVGGNSEQEKRSGKNIFNLQEWYKGAYPNQCTKELLANGFKLNFTAGADAFIGTTIINVGTKYEGNHYQLIGVKPNAKYTFSISSMPKCYINELDEELINLRFIQLTSNYNKASYTFTTNANTKYLLLRLGIQNADYTTYSFTDIQIEEGEVATEYEAYGAMPSPNYPSPVESCGEDVNYFNKDTAVHGYVSDVSGKFISDTTKYASDYIEVEQNENYYITKQDNTNWGAWYDKDKNFISGISSYGLVIAPSNAKYMRITIKNDDYLNIMKIQKGAIATPWSPYGQGSINATKCNKNIFDFKKFYELNGVANCTKELLTNGFKLNFTAGVDAWIGGIPTKPGTEIQNKAAAIKVKPNTKYTISLSEVGKNYVCELDENFRALPYRQIISNKLTFTTAPNSKYVVFRFGLQSNNHTSYTFTNIQFEEGDFTTYIAHQSQSYTLFTQKPFRKVRNTKDTFIKKVGKWHERHYIKRVVFDGTETKWQMGTYSGEKKQFYIEISSKPSNSTNITMSSHFLYTSDFSSGYHLYMNFNASLLVFVYPVYNGTPINTLNDWKAYLAEQYANGTPVYVDYILETPEDIECTEEQIEVLDELYNKPIYSPITNIFSDDKISPNFTLKYNYVLQMPSLEAPSEIRNVGGVINLLNFSNSTNTIGGVTRTIENGEITLNGTPTSNSYNQTIYTFTATKKGIYTLLPFKSISDKDIRLIYSINDSSFVNDDDNPQILLKVGDILKINLRISNTYKLNNFVLAPMLYYGTATTGWTGYNHGSIPIHKVNSKSIFDKETDIELNSQFRGYRNASISNNEYFYGIKVAVNPNKTYKVLNFTYDISNLCFFDKDMNFICGNPFDMKEKQKLFTTPNNSYFITLAIDKRNVDELTILEYELITFPLEEGQVLHKDDYLADDGIHQKKKTMIFDGINNKFVEKGDKFSTYATSAINGIKKATTNNELVQCYSNFFEALSTNEIYNNGKLGIAINQYGAIWIGLDTNLKINTVDSLNNLLNKIYEEGKPLIIEYELATEQIIPYTPEQQEAYEELQNLLMYEDYTDISCIDEVAPDLQLTYKKKLEIEVVNNGNIESRPILKINKTKNDSVGLEVNNVRFKYNFPENENYVEIDSEEKTTLYEQLNRNRQLEIGYEFPKMLVGKNKIKFTEGDAVLEIKRKDRWL